MPVTAGILIQPLLPFPTPHLSTGKSQGTKSGKSQEVYRWQLGHVPRRDIGDQVPIREVRWHLFEVHTGL